MHKISVCMATYNGERYLKQQLDSVLKQLSKNDEVIISDDSSIDSTVDIIKSFKDKRIKLFENNRFYNPIYNFENALQHSTGEIIFLCDQDDIWEDNKISAVYELLKYYDLVISDCVLIDKKGNIINDSFFNLMNSGSGFIKNIYRNTYMGCCMAFNRRILNIALPFPKNIPMHDVWIGLIAEVFGKTYFCNQSLVRYRRHTQNTSPKIRRSRYSFKEKIKFRSILLHNIFLRIIHIKLLYRIFDKDYV